MILDDDGPGHPAHFSKQFGRVVGVMKHVDEDGIVETSILERQRASIKFPHRDVRIRPHVNVATFNREIWTLRQYRCRNLTAAGANVENPAALRQQIRDGFGKDLNASRKDHMPVDRPDRSPSERLVNGHNATLSSELKGWVFCHLQFRRQSDSNSCSIVRQQIQP
jgi:hypothetical protein